MTRKWRPLEAPAEPPEPEPSLWRTARSGKPYAVVRDHVFLISPVEDFGTIWYKWGMKRPGSETWDFSSTYYQTEDEAKAAALAQLGIVPPSPPPARVRRINLD